MTNVSAPAKEKFEALFADHDHSVGVKLAAELAADMERPAAPGDMYKIHPIPWAARLEWLVTDVHHTDPDKLRVVPADDITFLVGEGDVIAAGVKDMVGRCSAAVWVPRRMLDNLYRTDHKHTFWANQCHKMVCRLGIATSHDVAKGGIIIDADDRIHRSHIREVETARAVIEAMVTGAEVMVKTDALTKCQSRYSIWIQVVGRTDWRLWANDMRKSTALAEVDKMRKVLVGK